MKPNNIYQSFNLAALTWAENFNEGYLRYISLKKELTNLIAHIPILEVFGGSGELT
jgi:hypothetical protein